MLHRSVAGYLLSAACDMTREDCGGTGAVEAVRAVHNDMLARLRAEVRHQRPHK